MRHALLCLLLLSVRTMSLSQVDVSEKARVDSILAAQITALETALAKDVDTSYTKARILDELRTIRLSLLDFSFKNQGVARKYSEFIAALQNVIKVREGTIADRDLQLSQKVNDVVNGMFTQLKTISDDKQVLQRQIELLVPYREQAVQLQKERIDLQDSLGKMDARLESVRKGPFNFSIGLGFNLGYGDQPQYVIQVDSTAKESPTRFSFSGIVSVLLTYRFDGFNIHLNVPLSELSFTSSEGVGLFNKRIALGLGLSFPIGSREGKNSLSYGFILNVAQVTKIDYDLVRQDKKYSLSEGIKLNLDTVPTRSAAFISLTFGLIYDL